MIPKWRNRFALFPRRIAGRWVWLERFRWCDTTNPKVCPTCFKRGCIHIRYDEAASFTYTYWRIYEARHGIFYRKETSFFIPGALPPPWPSYEWRKVSPPTANVIKGPWQQRVV